MIYEILKDFVVTAADKTLWHYVKGPSPYGEKEKVASQSVESQSAELPSVESSKEQNAPSVASLTPEIFRYDASDGSRLNNLCSGYDCLANVCDFSIMHFHIMANVFRES